MTKHVSAAVPAWFVLLMTASIFSCGIFVGIAVMVMRESPASHLIPRYSPQVRTTGGSTQLPPGRAANPHFAVRFEGEGRQ